MKKFIIYNLTNRSFFKGVGNIKEEKPIFSFEAIDAAHYDNREIAEQLADKAASQMLQQTAQNSCWNDGFALTVLEVYV